MVTLHRFKVLLWFAATVDWIRPDAFDRFVRRVDAIVD